MRKKYGIFIVIFIILLAGFLVTLLNNLYSFDYLYNSIIRRDFAVNPRVEMLADKDYEIRIWYYPFYRTIKDTDEVEVFKEVQKELNKTYSNIKIFVGEVDFSSGQEKLMKSIKEGNPPDIFFNLSDYSLIDEALQVPVSPYISDIEKEGYYTVNWNKISHRDKLWGWPTLVQQQLWIANRDLEFTKYGSLQFNRKINFLDKNSLLLNYYDETLLKQLLSLAGLDTFKLEKRELDIDTYRALEEVFYFLYRLRQDDILYSNSPETPDVFLKELLEDKAVMIGPVNPYLARFVREKKQDQVDLIPLDNLVQTYNLNIFRQRDYKGDDHTKAVMEVARVLSQKIAGTVAEDLGMAKAYIEAGEKQNVSTRELLVIKPEYKKYWEEIVFPAWIEFWEEDLTPVDVMAKF